MARNLISSLFVKLTANTTEFQTGMRRAEKTLTRTQKQFAQASKVVKSFSGVLGGVASAGALTALARNAVNAGSRITDLATQTRTGIEAFQILSVAAEDAGTSQDVLARGLRNLESRLAQAESGTKSYRKAVSDLGLDVGQLLQLPQELRLEKIGQAYAGASDKANAYAAVQRIIGDEAGPQLLEVLQRLSTEGFDELSDSARNAALVLSEDAAKGMDDLADRAGRSKKAVTNLTAELINMATKVGVPALNLGYVDDLGKKAMAAARDNLQPRSGPFEFPMAPPSRDEYWPQGQPAESLTRTAASLKASQEAAQGAAVSVLRFNEGMGQAIGASTLLSLETANLTEGLKNVAFDGFENVKTVIEQSTEAMRTWQDDAADGVRSFAFAIEDGLLNATKEGKTAFADMAKFILAEIQRIFIVSQIIRPLFGAIGGGLTGMGLGTLGSAFSDYGGGRASGGPVMAGKTYLVGERGPELLTMGANGHVTPNGAGGAAVHIDFVDMRGADPTAVARFEKLLARINGSIENRAVAAVGQTYSRNPQYLR